MGKRDEKLTKTMAHKATGGESKHEATDGESKHNKNQVSLKVVPLERLLKITTEDFVTLNGANISENCVNTRYSSATASCHNSTLSTPSSGSGLRVSVFDAGRTRKNSQLLRQLSAFEHSMVLVSTGGQARLI